MKRPPKTWFNRCVRQVKAKGEVIDPKAVCGKVWAHKSTKEKRKTIRKEEK